jgi:hypothetical protein
VHRLGNARSAVTNRRQADAFARRAGPLALALRDQGLSLRQIGLELLRYRLAARQGGLDRPLCCTSVRWLLARYRRLPALFQLPEAWKSTISPPATSTPVSASASANAKPELQEGRPPDVNGRPAGAGPHPYGDPCVVAEPSWW